MIVAGIQITGISDCEWGGDSPAVFADRIVHLRVAIDPDRVVILMERLLRLLLLPLAADRCRIIQHVPQAEHASCASTVPQDSQGQVEFVRYLASQRALLDASLEYIVAQEQRWSAAAEIAGLLQSEQFP